MIKCGMFSCEEDFITYEDLDTPCVGIEDNKCVSCETVRDTIKANPGNFFKDKKSAVESLFGTCQMPRLLKKKI